MLAIFFHPATLLLTVALIALVAYIIVKLKHSPKFDKFCKDLAEDVTPKTTPPKTKEVINKIDNAESALKDRVTQQNKEAKKLEEENKIIKDYLDTRGVGNKKGERL